MPAEEHNASQDIDGKEQSLLDHLIELRDRLLHMVLAVLVLFLALFPFSEEIFTAVAQPLLALMPEGTSMIATSVTSPFLVPFKLVLLLAVLLAVPYLLHQMWAFVAPGLYSHEKRLAAPLLISSVFLFYCGIAFAYFVVFPLVFRFLTGVAPEGVAVMTDISRYLDFVLKMFFAFGLAFEVPIATILVVWSGMTTAEALAAKRPYIIVAAFVFGMLLTPPDVISQTLLAVPMWALFELGLVFSRWYAKKPDDEEEEENRIGGEAVAAAAAGTATTSSRVEPSFGEVDESGVSSDAEESEDEDSNDSGHGEYEPPTEDELDAELDRIEAEEDEPKEPEGQDANEDDHEKK